MCGLLISGLSIVDDHHIPAILELLPAPPRMVLLAGVAFAFYDCIPPFMLILLVLIALFMLILSTSPTNWFCISEELTLGKLLRTSMPPFF